MTSPIIRHPVHKALHRPLLFAGVDRKHFFMSMVIGAVVFREFYSLLAGVLVSSLLYACAWWAAAHDPQLPYIIMSSRKFRTRYDPGKYEPKEGW